MRWVTRLLWIFTCCLGAWAVGLIAVSRGESINAIWFVAAAVCVYAIAYRFYSSFLAARVLTLDDTHVTPAERHNDGRDFVPTNRWV
ncbi:MAG TPA: carbon starvation CstA family protein, partial [Candidatus Binatia bacterium]|nr:carbon starvation CstA family protein [Candidatus Binatia bacterium]